MLLPHVPQVPVPPNRQMGKREAKFDDRVPQFHMLVADLPKYPVTRDWLNPVKSWGMMLNDKIGNCTIAGFAHFLQAVIANETGLAPSIPDDAVLRMYEIICGYDPKRPDATDNGGVLLDVLTYILKNGFLGHNIDGFAQVDPTHEATVKTAINTMGGVYTGFSLPLFAEDENDWLMIPSSAANAAVNSWGGHCVYIGAYDADYYYAVSWGYKLRIAKAFFLKYCDECWAVMLRDWVSRNMTAPNNETLWMLHKQMAAFKAEVA